MESNVRTFVIVRNIEISESQICFEYRIKPLLMTKCLTFIYIYIPKCLIMAASPNSKRQNAAKRNPDGSKSRKVKISTAAAAAAGRVIRSGI